MVTKETNGNLTRIINSANGRVILSIERETEGNKMVLHMEGSIKTPSADGLSETLLEALEEVECLVIDMENVIYIASAGLRSLLTAQQYVDDHEGRDMIIRNANEEVREVFEMTGFDGILNIEK